MKLSIVTMTPEMAEIILSANVKNRPISKGNLNYWKQVLIGDAVTLSHQGIAIVGTLLDPVRLLDGQHRLLAIIETGISMKTALIENAPEESFSNLDNGMPRSLANRAEIEVSEAQYASFFYYATRAGKTFKPPVKLIKEITRIVTPYTHGVFNKKQKCVSLVSIRCAFIIQQKKYGTNHSSAFQTGDFSSLSSSLMALYKRQLTDPLGTKGGSSGAHLFVATWRAIENPGMQRVASVKSPSSDAREIIASEFQSMQVLIDSYSPVVSRMTSYDHNLAKQ